MISYIFICVSLIGCDNQIINPVGSDPADGVENFGYYLELESELQYDGNYYHMLFLDGYIQTFTRLTARTGSTYKIQKLFWSTDTEYIIQFWGADNYTDVVNGISYTYEGNGYTVLGPWQDSVTDTITIYCSYMDEYDMIYTDSLKVILE